MYSHVVIRQQKILARLCIPKSYRKGTRPLSWRTTTDGFYNARINKRDHVIHLVLFQNFLQYSVSKIKQSLTKILNFIQELLMNSTKILRLGTYWIYMQIMAPGISPPKHKEWTSNKNKTCFLFDPKASSHSWKEHVRSSFRASLSQIHKRLRLGG